MIDPKSLRPGNWIHRKGSSAYGIVNGKLLALLEEDEKERERFEYIELSGELLEAAGFTNQHGEGDRLWLLEKFPQNDDLRYALALLNTVDTGFELIPYALGLKKAPVKYVHQFQNLFFLVTGGSELSLPESAKIINLVHAK